MIQKTAAASCLVTPDKKLPMPVKRALMDLPIEPNNSTFAPDIKRSKQNVEPVDNNALDKVDDKFIFLD